MEELILLRITGEDRPGLTANIMDVLARHDVDIQDIGQADNTQPSHWASSSV